MSALWSVVVLNLLAAPPATHELTSPRFRIVHTERATAAAKVLQRDLEGIRDDLAVTLGGDWPGVTEIRLGFDREEYEALALPEGRPPPWAVALAYPGQNVVLVEAHSLVTPSGPLTLRHELLHVALGQFGTGWPHWFQEGLAQEFTGERKWTLSQVATLTLAVTQDRIFDFEALTGRFPEEQSEVDIAYAQSAAFVEFLRRRHGTSAFRLLIARVQNGDHFEKAFGVAFGVPLSMEEAAFLEELPRKYPWWPVLTSGETVWAGLSLLVCLAFLVRRRGVLRLRAQQLKEESEHEAAQALVGLQPANDLPESIEIESESAPPWVVNIVRESAQK